MLSNLGKGRCFLRPKLMCCGCARARVSHWDGNHVATGGDVIYNLWPVLIWPYNRNIVTQHNLRFPRPDMTVCVCKCN